MHEKLELLAALPERLQEYKEKLTDKQLGFRVYDVTNTLAVQAQRCLKGEDLPDTIDLVLNRKGVMITGKNELEKLIDDLEVEV